MTGMYSYTPPTVTVDGVVFQIVAGQLMVLLIQRARDPFKNAWALPGVYCSREETTTEALRRAWRSKAGLPATAVAYTEQLYTFDVAAAQDPRGHAVSVIYLGLSHDLQPAGANAENPTFFAVDTLPQLAYEHQTIIAAARERLRNKLTYTNIAYALLPKQFSLSQLQTAYEAALGQPLDKRNFRKKIAALEIIEPTGTYNKEGAHRPARLYRFKQQQLQVVSRNLE